MQNSQERRNLRSNSSTSDLALVASDPEEILRRTDDPPFYTTFRQPRKAVQEPAVNLETDLESDEERPPSSAMQRTTPTLDVPQNPSKILSHLHLFPSIQRITKKEGRRIYAFETNKPLIKVAKDAISHSFQAGYEEARRDIKIALFYFVKNVST